MAKALYEEPVFLHVGFPKCGSSFLQKQYFIKSNGFLNLLKEAEDWRLFIQHQLLAAQSTNYQIPALCLPEDVENLLVGCSSETFTGGGVGGVDISIAMKRWARLFPNTRVLIVLRDQRSLVFSWYRQLVKGGYFRSYCKFVKELQWNSQQSLWGRLNYHKVYELISNIFEEVLVIPYELLVNEPQEFSARICRFYGQPIIENVRENISQSPNELVIRRAMNYLWRHGVGLPYHSLLPSYVVGEGRNVSNHLDQKEFRDNIRGPLSRNVRRLSRVLPSMASLERLSWLEADVYKKYEDDFSQSNRMLSDRLDLHLDRFGYLGCSD